MQSTPLPKFQLFLTLLIQLTEPVTATLIYPFIAIAVSGFTQGDEKKTGYYAGIIESVFFISESLSVYNWGRASDVYGRKPIFLIGPLGLSIAVICFGLSQSFWGMVLSRAAMGLSKTMMAEMTDETNRADAFTLMPVVFTIGATMGPALGGILADPARRWPNVFGKITFFKEYRWFLSCSAAGSIAFIAFLLSFWGLKETLPSKVEQKRTSESSSLLLDDSRPSPYYGSLQEPSGDMVPSPPPRATPSARLLLKDPNLRITFMSMGFLAFTDMSYSVLIPLIYSTSISTGGLGLSPYQVGLILGIFMFANSIWNWVVLTPVMKKLGTRRTVIVAYGFYLAHFALLWTLREVAARAGGVTPLVWAILIFQLFVSTVIITAYNAMHLLIVMNAPSNALGSVNGLAQVASAGCRAFAPFLSSSLYSISLESGIAGGHLVEIVLMGVTVVGIYCMSRLPS